MSLKQAKQDIKKDEQDGWRLRKLDKQNKILGEHCDLVGKSETDPGLGHTNPVYVKISVIIV